MSYGEMFDGLAQLWSIMLVALCISVPLGLWKLVEIIIWLVHHIEVTIK